MDPIVSALLRASREGMVPPDSPVLLAVSGGADSMALLHGAVEAASDAGWALSVAHVHHGWRGRDADRDLSFVADHARRFDLPFFSRRRDARGASRELRLSPEAGARHVRYEALHEMAREAGAPRIATAHQRDDTVESYVLARKRRGGLARLAGPREERADGVVRPLLAVPRAEILRFLADRGIAYRHDASNGDLGLARNRVRRELTAASEEELLEMAREVARLVEERRRLENDFAERIEPRTCTGPAGTIVDAALLAGCCAELQRLALERLAAPLARPGRPPMTGREREQILALLARGGDFRFEAGRRIRFARRGATLHIQARPPAPAATVYDSARQISTRREGEGVVP